MWIGSNDKLGIIAEPVTVRIRRQVGAYTDLRQLESRPVLGCRKFDLTCEQIRRLQHPNAVVCVGTQKEAVERASRRSGFAALNHLARIEIFENVVMESGGRCDDLSRD